MFKSVGLLLNSTGISGVNPLEPEILLEAASSIFIALLTEGPGVDSFSSELSSVSMVGSAKVVSFGGGSLLQILVSRQKGFFTFGFDRTASIGVIGRCISCLTFFADIMIPGVPAVIVMFGRSSSPDEAPSFGLKKLLENSKLK